MSLRIRKDGRVLCAAMHPEKEGDIYIDDTIHYHLSAIEGVLVSESMDEKEGRGGHGNHGQWWWVNNIPKDVNIEQ